MDGFTIKCNKCGKEQMLSSDMHFSVDKTISLYVASYQEEIIIECECGNSVEEEPYR